MSWTQVLGFSPYHREMDFGPKASSASLFSLQKVWVWNPFQTYLLNARTTCSGMSNDLEEVSDPRKSAIIDIELEKLDTEADAVSETRLADTCSLCKIHYTSFFGTEKANTTTVNTVNFAVLASKLNCLIATSEHVLSVISSRSGFASFISTYAPTLSSISEEKDLFYQQLNSVISKQPWHERLY
ncbi:unnamed protein product [Caretta caretta]